jgi:predicted dehydrogenase
LTGTTFTGNLSENPQWFSIDCIGEKSRIMTDEIRINDVVGKLCLFPGNKEVELPDEKSLQRRDFQLAFTRSIGAFVNSVRQGKTPPVTGEDGLRALLIEEAIVVSQAQKAAVTIANDEF